MPKKRHGCLQIEEELVKQAVAGKRRLWAIRSTWKVATFPQNPDLLRIPQLKRPKLHATPTATRIQLLSGCRSAKCALDHDEFEVH